MRAYSTPESTAAGEATVLAIGETVLAVAVAGWIAYTRGSVVHIAISACLVPFLLLRTERSTALAVKWSERVVDGWLRALNRIAAKRWWTFPAIMVLICFLSVAFISIRSVTILWVAVRHPLYSISEIPANWYRTVFAMDLRHPPEPVPGMEMLHSEKLEAFRFSGFLETWRGSLTDRHKGWLNWLFVSPLLAVLLYAPPMLYRLSLKSTSLVYLPFLWVIRDSFHADLNLRERLIDLKDSSFERLKRWYAEFVLVGLNLIPLALYLVVHSWAAELLRRLHASTHPRLQTLLAVFLFLQPDQPNVKGWHVARFVNASITLWMFWFAESKLRLLDFQKPVHEGRTTGLLNSALLVRGTLTLYIITCTLYLLLGAVDWHELARVTIQVVSLVPMTMEGGFGKIGIGSGLARRAYAEWKPAWGE